MSIRWTVAILYVLSVGHSHGAIWNQVHTLSETQSDAPTAESPRFAVGEKQITGDGKKKCL